MRRCLNEDIKLIEPDTMSVVPGSSVQALRGRCSRRARFKGVKLSAGRCAHLKKSAIQAQLQTVRNMMLAPCPGLGPMHLYMHVMCRPTWCRRCEESIDHLHNSETCPPLGARRPTGVGGLFESCGHVFQRVLYHVNQENEAHEYCCRRRLHPS